MDDPGTAIDAVELTASDGVSLRADLALPAEPVAAAIICHPHPQYGGTRHDHVVSALFEALPRRRIAALRFDFRAEFDDGRGERLDAEAALDELATRLPAVPMIVAGYSFGALIALSLEPLTEGSDTSVTGALLVAPPLTMTGPPPTPAVPTLVVVPAHDQFCPPDAARPIVGRWPHATMATVEMGDHFLRGRTAAVTDAVTDWLDELLSPR